MTTARPQLEWTDDNRAYRNRAHYYAYKRSDEQSDRKWRLAVFSMLTDQPNEIEEKLGEYRVTTLADAQELAQALADQRGLIW
jgi:hypothetical protein